MEELITRLESGELSPEQFLAAVAEQFPDSAQLAQQFANDFRASQPTDVQPSPQQAAQLPTSNVPSATLPRPIVREAAPAGSAKAARDFAKQQLGVLELERKRETGEITAREFRREVEKLGDPVSPFDASGEFAQPFAGALGEPFTPREATPGDFSTLDRERFDSLGNLTQPFVGAFGEQPSTAIRTDTPISQAFDPSEVPPGVGQFRTTGGLRFARPGPPSVLRQTPSFAPDVGGFVSEENQDVFDTARAPTFVSEENQDVFENEAVGSAAFNQRAGAFGRISQTSEQDPFDVSGFNEGGNRNAIFGAALNRFDPTPNQRTFFQNQRDDIFQQFQSLRGKEAFEGRDPEQLSQSNFLNTFDFAAAFRNATPAKRQNPGSSISTPRSAFNQRVRFR